jgi:hypothetical protein
MNLKVTIRSMPDVFPTVVSVRRTIRGIAALIVKCPI